ncbi:hypothetical protein ACP70R_046611 [Stipagrostis hirtigluma subsp. patula]
MDARAKLVAPASAEEGSVDGRTKLVAPASAGEGSMDVLASLYDVVVPDSEGADEDDVCLCKRCGEVHGVKDVDECRRIRREASRCDRCGLIHKDYDLMVWIIDGFDNFSCELYIPNIDELVMDGSTIILPEHVQEKIDELSPRAQRKRKRDAEKKAQDT